MVLTPQCTYPNPVTACNVLVYNTCATVYDDLFICYFLSVELNLLRKVPQYIYLTFYFFIYFNSAEFDNPHTHTSTQYNMLFLYCAIYTTVDLHKDEECTRKDEDLSLCAMTPSSSSLL